ncbi:hypothetical protein BH11PLA2_BH11PLA2_26930 [soil metagenome]
MTDAKVQVAGSAAVTADDMSSINADGGGVGITLATGVNVAAGISVALNRVAAGASAIIQNSTVTANNDVTITGTSAASIKSLTIGAAVASSLNGSDNVAGLSFNLAGAGAGASNEVNNTAEAMIIGGKVLSNSGRVTLAAQDNSVIHADGGALAVELSLLNKGKLSANVSLGAAAAVNSVVNLTRTAILSGPSGTVAVVTANGTVGDVSVTANSNARIDSLTIA